eukprot:CAMPEP_0180122548 /NCGR_PEP_ID=MMETSP0986-20121125/3632_1 /TAXON_ID=697907 /ORGANISM="non described non described, Strain CCMP2293" /LENGTH=127 /DNA_ID=CAMNT_0022061739 /DNA_START=208 /DNA_END=592 /DNA_ORIENTATION=+
MKKEKAIDMPGPVMIHEAQSRIPFLWRHSRLRFRALSSGRKRNLGHLHLQLPLSPSPPAGGKVAVAFAAAASTVVALSRESSSSRTANPIANSDGAAASERNVPSLQQSSTAARQIVSADVLPMPCG